MQSWIVTEVNRTTGERNTQHVQAESLTQAVQSARQLRGWQGAIVHASLNNPPGSRQNQNRGMAGGGDDVGQLEEGGYQGGRQQQQRGFSGGQGFAWGGPGPAGARFHRPYAQLANEIEQTASNLNHLLTEAQRHPEMRVLSSMNPGDPRNKLVIEVCQITHRNDAPQQRQQQYGQQRGRQQQYGGQQTESRPPATKPASHRVMVDA